MVGRYGEIHIPYVPTNLIVRVSWLGYNIYAGKCYVRMNCDSGSLVV